MITSNKNTQDITQYLRKSESILFNTTLYTLFFQALPHLIENNIELHHNIIFQNFVKKENFPTQRKWPETTTWKNFELLLAMKKDGSSEVEVVTIKEYFMAIRTGNIALSTLIQKADCLPKENDVVEETEEERNLRERQEQKNYKENATSDEEDEEEDNEEGESDEEKNKKKDKKKEKRIFFTKEKNKQRRSSKKGKRSRNKHTSVSTKITRRKRN
jgi:Mg-chelatase subunit ChlI